MAEPRLTRRPGHTTVRPGERHSIFSDAKQSARFGRVILSIDVEDEILIICGDTRLDYVVAAVGVVTFKQDRLELFHVHEIEQIALDVGT
jgi:hypothetical protein